MNRLEPKREVTMTVRQIVDLGLWSEVCKYKGWEEWILNEGRISEDEEVTFDSAFRKAENEPETLPDKEIAFSLRGDDLEILNSIKEHLPDNREDILSWVCYLENSIKEQL